MIKDVLHQPFELILKEPMDVCPRGMHQVSFFEFVYIVKGKGKQLINETKIDYSTGQLFLLAPEDGHDFVFETTTQLFFIRIDHIYLKDNSKSLLQKIELILNNVNKIPGCVLKKKEDKIAVNAIMKAIIYEHQNKTRYSQELINSYIGTILVIVARNLMIAVPGKIDAMTDHRITGILQYVQANIYSPEKLRVAVISKEFNVSETYLGRFFKKQTNETLQQYIETYKLKLIEYRLIQSDLRINEIVDQFGFTDKSHLNRFFKKFHQVSPSDYRKNNLN
ncbi:AraC family transcriptional regulator [Pedobacter chinensis]|uniref:AraC family transcriptional regulator n=1 Tax=Pedobacter chinensis TaxID=2282421 RepID=A0A369PVF4_9SPHI|nr:AraC family transcriptional regulator [Pedobacter chinensis]RDC54689.1 AraC family transcriptional regulator [Pedobacter chinensis]